MAKIKQMPYVPWTEQEKQTLLDLVKKHGNKWYFISLTLKRSDDSCRNMWIRLTTTMNPTRQKNCVTRKPKFRESWSHEEDKLIETLIEPYFLAKSLKKIKWKKIKEDSFPNRSCNSIRNRLRRIQFRRKFSHSSSVNNCDVQESQSLASEESLDVVGILLNEF